MSVRRLAPLVLSLAIAAAPAFAGPREDARAQNAVRVMQEIQRIPEAAIPDRLIDDAHAIVVVPDTVKAGLLFAGRRGHGVMAVKTADGTWSNPSFVTLTGGSIGFQAGVQSADVVLVFRSPRGLDDIVNGKFTLGADAGVAAGPVGRNASTATDGQLQAEIWSWSRARGLFAGIALDGAVLSIDHRANEAVYGRDVTPRMVFEARHPQPPSAAVVAFRDLLEEASNTAQARRGPVPQPAPAPAADATPVAPPPTAEPAGQAQPVPQQGFQPVDDSNPTTTEPLPDTP
ncbi:MAG: lipid-binding SYLF domain-containing protein [Pseudoxanthomonas suwonensis]|nr:lipid-binding SYLF domain-containing protein [Pseudoxanthomonas suwonensis]